jgi:hypothetical protein
MSDAINPSHYTSGTIECIEAIEASMSADEFQGFLKGNCMKYLWRYRQKGGLQDLLKSEWYQTRLIAFVETQAANQAGTDPRQDSATNEPVTLEGGGVIGLRGSSSSFIAFD